jgi:hypothetical protein
MKVALSIAACALLLVVSSGCLFEPVHSGYEGMVFKMNSAAPAYYLVGSNEMSHFTNFSKASYSITVLHNNKTKVDWALKIDKTNLTTGKISFVFDHNLSTFYAYDLKKDQPFSFTFKIESSDPYITSKTFFNGTNTLTGHFASSSANLDKDYPGIVLAHPTGSQQYLNLQTDTWHFSVEIRTSGHYV